VWFNVNFRNGTSLQVDLSQSRKGGSWKEAEPPPPTTDEKEEAPRPLADLRDVHQTQKIKSSPTVTLLKAQSGALVQRLSHNDSRCYSLPPLAGSVAALGFKQGAEWDSSRRQVAGVNGLSCSTQSTEAPLSVEVGDFVLLREHENDWELHYDFRTYFYQFAGTTRTYCNWQKIRPAVVALRMVCESTPQWQHTAAPSQY
jgi:hypothetical protein